MIRFALLLLVCCGSVQAHTYQIRSDAGGRASAVCLGRMRTTSGLSWLLVTNRHFFRGKPGRVWAQDERGQWVVGTDVRLSGTDADLAAFFATGRFRLIRVADNVPSGSPAVICGYTPSRQQLCFRGEIQAGGSVTSSGRHVLPGDSGGSVTVTTPGGEPLLAGVVYGYGARSRDSLFVPTRALREFVHTQYGRTLRCTPYSCPAPPPSAARAPSAPSPPRVDLERLAAFLAENHADQLRQPQPDLADLRDRVQSLERRTRTVIVRQDGREIGRQTYRTNDPIVLDVHRTPKE